MTDDRQLERFRQAVEEKNEEARRKAETGPRNPREPHVTPEEEPQLHDPAYPPRHGQVTADNWNQ